MHFRLTCTDGAGIAHLAECPTENPGTILMQVGVVGVAREIFLPDGASSADFLMVSVQPPCAITHISVCTHVKNPTYWQPYHCLGT